MSDIVLYEALVDRWIKEYAIDPNYGGSRIPL